MLYEIAVKNPDGTVSRGGLSATLKTVKKWINNPALADCRDMLMAIPANEEAIPAKYYREKGLRL